MHSIDLEFEIGSLELGIWNKIRIKVHCICLQGFTGCLLGNQSVILKYQHSNFHCNICEKFDFTRILWGYPILVVRKSCIKLWENVCKYEIKPYKEMPVSITSKTHVDVMFVGI